VRGIVWDIRAFRGGSVDRRQPLDADPVGGMVTSLSKLAPLAMALALALPRAAVAAESSPHDAVLHFAAERSAGSFLFARTLQPYLIATGDLASQIESACAFTPECEGTPSVTAELISAFGAAQKSSGALSEVEGSAGTLVAAEHFDEGTLEVPAFRASPAGFAGTAGMVFIEEYCGASCGGGFFLILKQTDSGWVVDQSLLAYIS